MKRLLSLLCVLATSGTVMPMIVAATPYQRKEIKLKNNINYQQTNNLETLKRNKRGVNDGNEFVGWNPLYASFTPNLWEEIIRIKYDSGNNLSLFQKEFLKKVKEYRHNNLFDIWNFFILDNNINIFSKLIFNNWDFVNSHWRNSTKSERIRIVTDQNVGTIYRVTIRTGDKKDYENDYLNNQIINEVLINTDLGKLFIINQQTILDSIKLKNPNIAISHLSVSDITTKSAKITVSSIGKYTKETWVNVYFEKNNLINLKNFINSDKAILNELNYLNPALDISKLKIISKTNKSVTIKIDDDYDEKKIYYEINNEENKIIDLVELINKAIFFKFRDDKSKIKFKNNIDNLQYSNIDLKIENKNIEKENFSSCNSIIFPVRNHEETYSSPACKYTKQIKKTRQITTGLSKNIGIEKSEGTSSTSDIKAGQNINVGLDAEVFKLNISNNLDSGFSTANSSSKKISLSKTFNLSNTNIEEDETSEEIEFPSQPIKVLPNQKIKIDFFTSKSNYITYINLKQNIYGEINVEITKENDTEETINFSIKDLLAELQKFDLLPPEITINDDDDSITFNGKMIINNLVSGFDTKLIVKDISSDNNENDSGAKPSRNSNATNQGTRGSQPQGDGSKRVSIDEQATISGTQNQKTRGTNQNNRYDVPGDGSCLFWSVVTAYLLPVRNNDEEFKTRFIQLFGTEEEWKNIQSLFQEFNLENYNNNQNLYANSIMQNLVINVFRNRVVNYIERNLDNPIHNDSLTFRNLILENNNNENVNSYLDGMRNIDRWGGEPEIVAMSNLLTANISVNNRDPYQPFNQNSSNTINIYHVNERTHYNFALSNQTPQIDTEYQRSVGGGCLNEDDNDIENNSNSLFLNKPQLKKDEYHFIDPETEQKSFKNDENLNIYLIKNQKMMNKYNSLSREEKQEKLNEINQHYQSLPENEQKAFKDKLKAMGTSAIGAGISTIGAKITVDGSTSATAAIGTTGEAMEMTPLLSEGSLVAAETLSVVEETAVVVTEGAVISAEAGAATALAPETLGLSLVIGGLAIAGTTLIWWLSHDNNVV